MMEPSSTTWLEYHRISWGHDVQLWPTYTDVAREIVHHRASMNAVDRLERLDRSFYRAEAGENRLLITFSPAGKLHAGLTVEAILLPTAWQQLCQIIGPAPHFRANVEALSDRTRTIVVNERIQEAASERNMYSRLQRWRLLRPEAVDPKTYYIRAVLSAKYAPMDDHRLLSMLGEISEIKDARVKFADVEERRTSVKLVWPNRVTEVTPGDPLAYSLLVQNSEVGCGAISLTGGVERLVCRNGMVAENTIFRLVHIGRDPHARLRLLAEGIREVLQKTDKFVQATRKATEALVDRPFDLLADLARENGWSEDFVQNAKRVFLSYRGESTLDATRWGVANAISASAAYLRGEGRIQVEKVAGRVVISS